MKRHHCNRDFVEHPTATELYQYQLGERFDPGAMAEVFEPLTANPVFSFRGRARLAGALMVTQHPQVYFNNRVPTASVSAGGQYAGQIALQPLLTEDETGSY